MADTSPTTRVTSISPPGILPKIMTKGEIMKIQKLPLPADIRLNGKIARLVRKPIKPHLCSECKIIIEVTEPYYTVEWAGSGLGSTKRPSRACVACLPQSLGIERTSEEWRLLWGGLFDYCQANIDELERTCRMRGLMLCMQKMWAKKESLCQSLPSAIPSAP